MAEIWRRNYACIKSNAQINRPLLRNEIFSREKIHFLQVQSFGMSHNLSKSAMKNFRPFLWPHVEHPSREKEENVPFSLKIDISEIFFTWNRSGVLGFYFNLLSNFSWIFQKNINYIIKFLSAQPLKTFRLIFLLKSFLYPNSHIFVRPKRVWLFGYVWLFGDSTVFITGTVTKYLG